MSSDSEDEDFAEYGTALDPLNEDDLPRKKPASLNDQVATDKYGRRRFHGAFTGGFSAGFFNSVGSLEGWTPSTFKSSRSDKAKEIQQKPEDFMDDEDMDEFGIAPKVLRATSDFNEGNKKRARRHNVSDGPIPGEPVLRELLQPVKETTGMKLLRKMGWKPGQGTGPRLTKMEKRKMKEEYKKTEVKVYGCTLPRDVDREKHYGSDSPCSTDDENDPQLSFAPCDYQPFLCKAKDNCFGLGYSGLDRRSVLSSNLNLFTPTPLRMEEKKKKVLITGQAFGVGAFEDDDEDIYVHEDMSQYDFSLAGEPTTSKQKQQTTTDALTNYYAGGTLIGFVLGTNAMTRKKYFPPPILPQGFKPVHVTRKSRFEPAPTEKLSLSKEQSHTSRKKGLQRHNLTATDRAQILSEATPKSAVQKDSVRSPTQEKCERLPAAELKKTENFDASKKGYSHFQPFVAYPEKQKRYEQYLTLCKVGQKDRLSYIQPLTMTEWEKERERVEFEQASRLYQPLSGILSDRFVSASQPEDVNSPLPSMKKDVDNDSDQRAAVKLKMFGRLTREESEWRPCSLLCKRFNIPELYAGGGESSDATPKSRSQFSVFNFLDAASYNRALKPPGSPVCNEPVNDILAPSDSTEVTTKQEPESESDRRDEMVCSEQKSEDSLLEFPDPPAKIDLYKAIFLSSSEDSDSDIEENNAANLTKGSMAKEMTLSETKKTEGVLESVLQEGREVEDKETALSDKIVVSTERNTHRNMSPPRGVFANLDLDALNTRKENSNKVLENKEESDISKIKPPTNDDNEESEQNNKLQQIEDNMYGPQLPSVPMTVIKNTSVPTVKTVLPSVVGSVYTDWVEKVKTVSHKSKHNKKHKKSSKHKKHKHKKKRH